MHGTACVCLLRPTSSESMQHCCCCCCWIITEYNAETCSPKLPAAITTYHYCSGIVLRSKTYNGQCAWQGWSSASAVSMGTALIITVTYHASTAVDCFWNVMALAQKPHSVLRRNGRVHLNRQGRQFSRLLAAEVCASAVVMLDTPCSEVMWKVLATHFIRQFPLQFPSRASPCAITFQLDSTAVYKVSDYFKRFKDYGITQGCKITLTFRWRRWCQI